MAFGFGTEASTWSSLEIFLLFVERPTPEGELARRRVRRLYDADMIVWMPIQKTGNDGFHFEKFV